MDRLTICPNSGHCNTASIHNIPYPPWMVPHSTYFHAKVFADRWLREYNVLRPHGRTNLNTGNVCGGRSPPTIRIDGVDIEPEAANVEKFGLGSCRPYFWKDKFYDYPPEDMILAAIKKHLVAGNG